MNKRWQISEDNVTWTRDVVPQNAGKLRITETRDLDAAQVFFRRKLSSPIIFWKDDFTYFKGFERRASGRCQTLYVRLQLQCGAAWQTFWTGEFSTGSGKWNYAECFFEVKPETVDRYTCLLKKKDVKRNLLQVAPVTVNVVSVPSLEFLVCQYSGGSFGCPIPTGFVAAHIWTPISPIQLGVLWREVVTTECVGGSPSEPEGAGWMLDTDDCATTGSAKYYRTPVISWPFGDPVIFLDGDGYPEPPDNSCSSWLNIGSYDYSINPPGIVPFYVCLSQGTPTVIDTARPMKECVEFILEGTECGLEGVRSDLFNWNPQGDAPGYVAGLDYVTGLASERSALLFVQKSDAKDPGASNPATIGEMTFKELVQLFLAMQCFYFIDRDGYLRVEHWTYFVLQDGFNLTDFTRVNEPLMYSHLSEAVPQVERLTAMEALSRDFVGKDIIYSGPCVGSEGDGTKEYVLGKITTDITFVLSDPDEISSEGFVVLASAYDGSEYNVIISPGAITGNYVSNAPMSTANIMRDYWTWNRFLPSANMNGVDVDFDDIRPNVEQQSVRAGMCCKVLRFDATETIGTDLSAILGDARAQVEDVEYDLSTDRVEFTLRYAYK